ncbi:DUF7657 domain-containing protein [Pseudomonas quasicaspiana]|uniref:DUF7657 domain-containing protein n=1 Tax=Pseudomonas quasicaspiana TaxID=2829821 RepID=UPI001E3FA538|nr:hypothetical protein [Pseudomonas quasicaspiana]MCD5979445.1 hypothetical protein [Pseudomonas quasicaspiana]
MTSNSPPCSLTLTAVSTPPDIEVPLPVAFFVRRKDVIIDVMTSRLFFTLCIALLMSIYCSTVWATEPQQSPAAGRGHIDLITFENNRITAQGWAAAEQASRQITSIAVLLNDKEVYAGVFERPLRPDVAEIFQRPQWLNSGWRVSFEIPDGIETGEYPVKAVARTATGESITLTSSATTQRIYIYQDPANDKRFIRTIKLVIACSILFLAIVFIKSTVITQRINQRFTLRLSEPALFSTAVLLVSFLFVAMGLTGSSLHHGQASAPFVEMDSVNIMGHDQPIRSDEWLVQTPFAIAQFNHRPPFPVVNKNVGEDGQNMMVTSMTSVPIAHVTALAKPATWGFFVFDLRRALSWNWCFPIVGCFLALAFVLNRLCDDHWKHGFLFSALFCSAPYVVAWSFWPAYTVFFPCVILLCALQILKTSSFYRLIPLGVLLGLAVAGFAFILYPPWQVSVGYVFIAMTIGIVIREKLYQQLTLPRATTYLFAIGVAGALLTAWWLDASDAVKTMSQTVYPGQRLTVGGTATLPLLLRGFTNIPTLQLINSTMSNQSEISSFYYLLLPLAALVALRAVQNRLTALEWSLTAICGIMLYYMFVGFPVDLAKYSLWGRSAPYRADLALGLASVILTRLLLSQKAQPQEPTHTVKFIAVMASAGWIYIVYRSLAQLDSTLTSGMPSSLVILILFITAALSYFLITNRFKPFILISLGLSLATTASFHPINIAPSEVRLRPAPTTADTLANTLEGKRVVVLESTTPAMFLIASGISVVNGINYFPQKTLWNRMDPDGKKRDIYNRYQHLAFVGAQPPAESYKLGTPHPDIVMVTLNLATFDFRLTGANVVLAPDNDKSRLDENKGLSFAGTATGWSWFTVK